MTRADLLAAAMELLRRAKPYFETTETESILSAYAALPEEKGESVAIAALTNIAKKFDNQAGACAQNALDRISASRTPPSATIVSESSQWSGEGRESGGPFAADDLVTEGHWAKVAAQIEAAPKIDESKFVDVPSVFDTASDDTTVRVPRIPTEAMLHAAMATSPMETENGITGRAYYPFHIYKAMIAAAEGKGE